MLQTTVVIILQIISIQRRHTRHQGGFPHLNGEDQHIGENTLQIYSYGRDLYDAMLAAIDAAQESIYLETYIWKGDEEGQEVKEQLARQPSQEVELHPF